MTAAPEPDAIVVGAGSVGNPTAYFLAREGLRVLVLDALPSAGQGQNKAAIGGVRATHSEPAKIQLCQRSLEVFSGWKASTGIDIGWKPGGYCFPAWDETVEATLRGLLPVQKRYRLDIDWRDADEIRRLVPGISPEELRGGTFSPADGQANPLRAAQAFESEARRLGATYRFGEAARALLLEGSAVAGVRTDRGDYRAPAVVVAAGVGASELCRPAALDVPILPESHEAGISAPVAPFLGPLVVDLRPGPEGRTTNFYFGQDADDQVIFCYTPRPAIPGENRTSTDEFMPTAAARLVRILPRLKNLTVRRLWRGLYPMTPDGSPLVGRAPNVSGLYLGVGMCGQGFMLGPGVGANLASLVAKGRPLLAPEVFDLLSPARDLYGGRRETLR